MENFENSDILFVHFITPSQYISERS